MRILILTPSFDGKTCINYTVGLANTFRHLSNVDVLPPLIGCADIGLARNTLLAHARARGPDILLWIDADIGFSAADVEAVTLPILMGRADVVAGLYPKKQLGALNYPVVFNENDVDDDVGYVGDRLEVEGYKYGDLDAAGFGFFAMSIKAADVLAINNVYCPGVGFSITNTLDERHAAAFASSVAIDKRQQVPRFNGEDVVACRALKQAGVPIHFSYDTRLSHNTGEFQFGGGQLDVDGIAKQHARAYDMMRKTR